jgi:6-phosphogluconolactonase (cycloisomerase 2 family)
MNNVVRRIASRSSWALALAMVVTQAHAAVVGYLGVVTQGIEVVSGLGGVDAIALSPDGARAYAASPVDSALTVFDRDPDTGALTFRQALVDASQGGSLDGLSGVSGVAIDPSGDHVYASALNASALLVFARTDQGLDLIDIYRSDTVAGLQNPMGVAISPDGRHVYVSTRNASTMSIVAFRVTDAAGRLAFLARYDQSAGNASTPVLSPDGKYLYVANTAGITLYARENEPSSATFGRLSLIENYPSGSGGIPGLGGVAAIAVDPLGADLYAVGASDDAVVTFARDTHNGRLSLVASYLNGTSGITGMSGPRALAVSPNGDRLYVAGYKASANNPGALIVFRRDRIDGSLSYLETHREGDGGFIDGLDKVLALTVSPEGANLYTASPLPGKIGLFSVAADPRPTFSAASFTVKTRPGVALTIDLFSRNGAPVGGALSLSSFSAASHGVLTQNGDGSLTYQPTQAFHGSDSFTYILSDGLGNTSTGTVTIIVNTPPIAKPATATTTVDTSTLILVLSNASDPDNDPLGLAAVSASARGGDTAAEGDGVRYTPPHGFTGTDTFTYTITDGIDSATADVTVTVEAHGSTSVGNSSDSGNSSSGHGGGGGAIDETLMLAGGLLAVLKKWVSSSNKGGS